MFALTPDWVVPSVLLTGMAATEMYAGRLRRHDTPSRDGASLYAVIGLIGVGYWLAFGLWAYQPSLAGPRLGDWALWAGAAVTAMGLALRIWSVALLGRYFTYVVKVTPDQTVVEAGPYCLIRHPSYTGGILTGIGIGLSMRTALAPAVIGITSFLGYWIRMRVEERALAEGIGEPYRAYMRRTMRLVPFVW